MRTRGNRKGVVEMDIYEHLNEIENLTTDMEARAFADQIVRELGE